MTLTPDVLCSAVSVSYGWVIRPCLGGLLRLYVVLPESACLLHSSFGPHFSFHGRHGVIYQTNIILTFLIRYWMRYAAAAITYFSFNIRCIFVTMLLHHNTLQVREAIAECMSAAYNGMEVASAQKMMMMNVWFILYLLKIAS